MRDYIIRRTVLLIPTFLLATMLVFGLLRFMPGSAVDIMLEETGANWLNVDRTVAVLKKEFGLDQPIHIQYWNFMSSVARGDLGTSFWGTQEPVAKIIGDALPVTLTLAFMAKALTVSIGIFVGVVSAIRQDTWLDYVLRVISIAGLSLPGFWIATLVVIFPAVLWGIIPPIFYTPFREDPWANLSQFIIPALVLGIHGSASTMRMTRSMMLEVLRQDYIRTAWAKGLAEKAVIMRHALKNALIPVVTIIGLQLATLLGGTVIIESIFGLPGLGRELVAAITMRDYPVVQGINLFFIVTVISVNLLVDISYGYLDPRIRYK